MLVQERKVVIVGAGAVGATFAYTLMQAGLASDIVLVDAQPDRASGEAMDMTHGLFFTPPVAIRAGDYDDCAGAALVVITAGARQKPGQSRLDLVQTNVAICNEIVDEVTRRTRQAVLLLATNPVDVVTWFALDRSDLPAGQLFGTGTVLDSARFRYLLSRHFTVDPRNVHAYIAGEHGDSEVALWSLTHIAGMSVESCCEQWGHTHPGLEREQVLHQVRDSAYHLIETKGSTFYAISLAMLRIAEAVLRDESSVLTVSARLSGQYGLPDVCLSLPRVVGRGGIVRTVAPALTEPEVQGLRRSAAVLRETIEQVRGTTTRGR